MKKKNSYVSREDVFYEYSTNEDFRKLIDTGKFRYVEGYVVINDDKYISANEDGKATLSEYAWDHLDECALSFSWQRIRRSKAKEILPQIIFHRDNDEQEISHYDDDKSASVVTLSEELRKKRKSFEQGEQIHQISTIGKTCWQYIYEIIQLKGISKSHFRICSLSIQIPIRL